MPASLRLAGGRPAAPGREHDRVAQACVPALLPAAARDPVMLCGTTLRRRYSVRSNWPRMPASLRLAGGRPAALVREHDRVAQACVPALLPAAARDPVMLCGKTLRPHSSVRSNWPRMPASLRLAGGRNASLVREHDRVAQACVPALLPAAARDPVMLCGETLRPRSSVRSNRPRMSASLRLAGGRNASLGRERDRVAQACVPALLPAAARDPVMLCGTTLSRRSSLRCDCGIANRVRTTNMYAFAKRTLVHVH